MDGLRAVLEIVMGYPVQYSNIPKIMRDYIVFNLHIWNGKKIFMQTDVNKYL